MPFTKKALISNNYKGGFSSSSASVGSVFGGGDSKDACIIGEVISDYPGKVFMQTRIGGTRIVDMLAGEQLPRIWESKEQGIFYE